MFRKFSYRKLFIVLFNVNRYHNNDSKGLVCFFSRYLKDVGIEVVFKAFLL